MTLKHEKTKQVLHLLCTCYCDYTQTKDRTQEKRNKAYPN
jgi:hypothetical protein